MSLLSSSRRRRSRRRTSAASTGRRRRRRGSVIQIVLAVVLCAAVAGGAVLGVRELSAAREKSKVRDVVGELRYACNNMDANALLDIINPAIADPLKLAAAVSGTNKNELMETIFSSLNGRLENVDVEEVLRSLSYEIKSIRLSGRQARVTALCTLTVNGIDLSRTATLDMERIEKEWYIMGADLDLGIGR